MQKTVTDTTNQMLKQASEMMKTQAIDIEQQSQRGIVDIETLQQTNQDLIDTINGVLQVQAEGRQKRADDRGRRWQRQTDDLKRALAQGPRRETLARAAGAGRWWPGLAGCGPQQSEFHIVAGSEQKSLEPLVQKFCAKQNVHVRSSTTRARSTSARWWPADARADHRRGLAGLEPLDRACTTSSTGVKDMKSDRPVAGDPGREAVQGQGTGLDRQAGADGRHPGRGAGRQADVPDDLGDPVELGRLGLSGDAGRGIRRRRARSIPARWTTRPREAKVKAMLGRRRAFVRLVGLARATSTSKTAQGGPAVRRDVELRGHAEGDQRRTRPGRRASRSTRSIRPRARPTPMRRSATSSTASRKRNARLLQRAAGLPPVAPRPRPRSPPTGGARAPGIAARPSRIPTGISSPPRSCRRSPCRTRR